MFTHLAQWRIWLMIICALLVLQGVVFWFTPPSNYRTSATDSKFARVWTYIDHLEYENDDPQVGRALRWAPMQGTIRIPQSVHANPVIVRMTIHTARPPEQPPMQVDITSGTTSTAFQLAPGWRTIALLAMPTTHAQQYHALNYTLTGSLLSERRDLGVAVHQISLIQSALPHIDDVRYLFVVALWLWLVVIGVARHWSWWVTMLPAVCVIGAWWMFPHVVAYHIPNQWNVVGYLWVLSVIVLLRPYRKAYLSPIWSLVGLAVVVALWQMGIGWLGVILLLMIWWTSVPWSDSAWPRQLSAPQWHVWMILGIAVVVAGCLRIAWLNDYPTGLFRDEARHGGLAWRILAGEWMIYSPLANLPAGYFYVSALPIALFDASAWSIRISAAVVGTASVLGLFWMLRPQWGTIFALWASVLLATLLWHIGLSRIGFPVTMGPFLTMIAVSAWLRIPHSTRPIVWAVPAGVATGLMLMVYHSARLMPLVVVLTVLLVLWQQRLSWRRFVPVFVVYTSIALIVAAPILWYALTQPDNYMRRIGVTSIFSDARIRGMPEWVALVDNVHAYIGMLFSAGDRNPRHFNLGAPQLNFFEALAFVVGVVWFWTRQRAWFVWLVGWLAIGLVSGVLSVDAPHAMRTVETIIPVVIMMAAGAYWMMQLIPVRWWSAVLIVMLLSNSAWSVSQYYAWQTHPRTQSRFDTDATNDVRFVQHLLQVKPSQNTKLYIPEAMRRSDLGVFLLHQSGVKVWRGDQAIVDTAQQHLVLVPRGAAVRWPAHAVQAMQLPASMQNRYELWCIGDCTNLTWLSMVSLRR